MLLKAEPGLEVPTLMESLPAEDQKVFKGLSADMREAAEGRYARHVVFRMIGLATSAGSPDDLSP